MILSICMMVKDEEKNIRRCLESLKVLMNNVDSELIVVDTGSHDKTIDIVKEYTDKIYFHKWNNNFSEIRNLSISYAKGDWIFIIDADEELLSPDKLIEFLNNKAESINYNTIGIKGKNFLTDNDKSDTAIINTLRLFRKGTIKYEGTVHNQCLYKRPVIYLDVFFNHYGYISNDKELMDRKFNRTSAILKNELMKNPDNIYYLYQLATSYEMHLDYREALDTIIKAYNIINEKDLSRSNYKYIYYRYASVETCLKDWTIIIKVCNEGINACKEYIDLYFMLAQAQAQLSEWEASINNYNIYFKLLDNYQQLSIKDDTSIMLYTLNMREQALNNICVCYLRLGKYEEAFYSACKISNSKIQQKSISVLVKSALEAGKEDGLLKYYNSSIAGNKTVENLFCIVLEDNITGDYKNKVCKISKLFSQIKGPYSDFNKIRLSILENNFESVDSLIQNLLIDNDFNEEPAFYGQLIYYLLKVKYPVESIFNKINEAKTNEFIEYCAIKFSDLCRLIKNNTKFTASDDLSTIKKNKLLSRCLIIIDSTLDDKEYLYYFNIYIENGISYIKKIYNEFILKNELINELKGNEDAFFLYMLKANEIKLHNNKLYIYYLRKALSMYPKMEKGIKIILEKSKNNFEINNEMEGYKKIFKENITKYIELKDFKKANSFIKEYEDIIKDDPDIYSIEGVIQIYEKQYDKAFITLTKGLNLYPNNFDINYNLAYLYELQKKYGTALKYYNIAKENCSDKETIQNISNIINSIEYEFHTEINKDTKKIVFFVKQGMDSFLNDIITSLSDKFETKEIVVTNYNQIDEGMKWADICWFEWCDELVIYGSKLPISKEKKVICRLHSYEAFTNYPSIVNWDNVDKIIFVANHIMENVLSKVNITKSKCDVIPNGINLKKFNFKERKKGFNIAYVGYINFKKGPMLLIHVFKAIYDMDKRYKLYIAGQFQEERYLLYFKQMIEAMGLQNNIIFDGWQKDISNWLENKNYIISTSVLEGNPLGVMEGMARGIKPLIHNFVGAKQQFGKYVWSSFDECKKMLNESYDSYEYRKYIESNFSLERQINKIFIMLNGLTGDNNVYEMNKEEHFIIEKKQKEAQVEDYYNNFLSYLINDRKRENPRHVYLKNRISQIVKKGQSVLDLGCGIGITTEHIKKLEAGKVIGVDISPKLIEYAKSTVKNVEFMVHDITNVSLDDEFDVIFMCDCMEHIPLEKYDELFSTIKKHLKPEGIVYISIPDNDYMRFVQQKRPDLMQIIDNSIDFELMNQLCKQNRMKISFYNSYGIHIGNEYNEYIITNFESFSKPWKVLLK